MNRHRQSLYTIGYSGHTITTFVEVLQAKRVTALLDIRTTPLSRKKGFSKNGLRLALEEAGIAYHHMKALGSPKELRNRLEIDKDYSTFFESFEQYLLLQEKSVYEAAALVATQKVCLMCVEDSPEMCHRSTVAKAIAQVFNSRLIIQHIPTYQISCAKKVNFALPLKLEDRTIR